MALGQAQVGGELVDPLVDRLALEPGQLAHRAGQDPPRRPAAVERRIGVLEDHLDRALVGGRPAGRRGGERVRRRARGSLPASGLSMPRIVLASVDLPEPDSPTSPSVSPSNSSRSTLTRAGHVVAALVERLGDVRRATGPGRRGRSRRRRSAAARRSRRGGRGGGSASSARRRPRRSAARRSGTARPPAGSGRRRRRSAGPCRSAAGCRGSSTARRCVLRTPRRGSDRSRPRVYGCSGCSKTAAASPSSTILPAYITPTRSHIVRMTPRLWAMSRTAAFVSAWSVRTRSSTLASTVASSPVVGSSRTRSFGSEASAMAMTTRCCIPPDSWCG